MSDKCFLTYNQQMKKLRDDKKIACKGTSNKKLLVRAGYFNIVNGYKTPFVSGVDAKGNHIYMSGTSISQLHAVKAFDDSLRSFLLRYITQVEEEVRALTSYKFDECNGKGTTPWYHTDAYDPNVSLKDKMQVISRAYKEISDSRLDYVRFYMDNHEHIPTWIMLKVINFSTFIDVLNCSRRDVPHAICELYDMLDTNGRPNVKLLIGSLHWMRKIRNSCAHNERVYCVHRSGRIIENYISALPASYARSKDQRIFDLLVYFKYYLPKSEYKRIVLQIKDMLLNLQSTIQPGAFDYVRGQMGIKNMTDLDTLISLPKNDIAYNLFDK